MGQIHYEDVDKALGRRSVLAGTSSRPAYSMHWAPRGGKRFTQSKRHRITFGDQPAEAPLKRINGSGTEASWASASEAMPLKTNVDSMLINGP